MKAIDQLSTSSETGADSAETEQQSLAAAEIEARLARVIEEMRAQLAEMEHSAQAAAAEERRLEGETEQARARETALDNRATVLHQAITVARADLAMARGTADEPTVQSELDQRKVSYLDAVEQQAEATQRIHDLAEQLVVSRSARASLEAEQSSKRIELEGVVAELERRRAEAHSARGQAELERIIAEIAEQERSIAAAQEALTAAQGKLDATRREVSTRMAKWPMQGKPYHRCHIRLTFGSAVFPGFLGAHARSTRSKVEANASEICNLCCGSVCGRCCGIGSSSTCRAKRRGRDASAPPGQRTCACWKPRPATGCH